MGPFVTPFLLLTVTVQPDNCAASTDLYSVVFSPGVLMSGAGGLVRIAFNRLIDKPPLFSSLSRAYQVLAGWLGRPWEDTCLTDLSFLWGLQRWWPWQSDPPRGPGLQPERNPEGRLCHVAATFWVLRLWPQSRASSAKPYSFQATNNAENFSALGMLP